MTKYIGLVKRLSILAVLLVCFGFVLFSGETRNVSAAPCCEECGVPRGGNIAPYCQSECGASSGSCYNSCVNGVRSCWRVCVTCGGGGGGTLCNLGTTVCPPGTFCIDGFNCVY
jgi:hypothetical protein